MNGFLRPLLTGSAGALALLIGLLVAGCATTPGEPRQPEEVEEPPRITTPAEGGVVALEARAREIELQVEGLSPRLMQAAEAGNLDVEARFTGVEPPIREAAVRAGVGQPTVTLSPENLETGGRYSLQLRFLLRGSATPWTDPITIEVGSVEIDASFFLLDALSRVELPGTDGGEPSLEEEAATVDQTPRFGVELSGEAPGEVTLRVLSPERTVVVEEALLLSQGTASWESPTPLELGGYTLECVATYPGGIRLAQPLRAPFAVREPVSPTAIAHAGGVSPVARPALRWRHQSGVAAYEVAFAERGTEDGNQEELSAILSETSTERVEAAQLVLEEEFLEEGGNYAWRVRPLLEEASGPWSEPFSFTYSPQPAAFAPVIVPGQEITYTQGTLEGSDDESPPREVRLTIPFELGVTEVTNALAASLINSGVIHQRFAVEGLVVRQATDGVSLLYLDTLEYGEQLGLLVGEDGRLTAVTGRARHPVVGVTWQGAMALARELSLLEGRPFDEDGLPGEAVDGERNAPIPPRERWSYRLPTEAEWEYAASGGETVRFSWGDGSPEGRANYYRSGDGFEDPYPPYTRAGGPTTPVGIFGEESPFGHLDLLGNVWEWCLDWYDPRAYGTVSEGAEGAADSPDEGAGATNGPNQGAESPVVNPRGPNEAIPDEFGVINRSLRGLAWNSRIEDLRLTNRGKYPPELGSWSIGVRLVLAPSTP